ncbi:MAG: M14 family metallopeptidase [Pirellulales bacterium]
MKTSVAREVKFHYSSRRILSGSDLSRRRLPYMEARAAADGPVVWLTAGCHSDEVGGIVVVQELFKRLRKLPLRTGSVHAFPLMNPIGFELGSRHLAISEEDLNRSFPGSATGTLAERIADLIFSSIEATAPAVVLDLHNDWIRSISYTVLDQPPTAAGSHAFAETSRFAGAAGFPVVLETEPLRRTLSHSLLQRGIAALTFELGESYIVNEANVQHGVSAIVRVLAELGMVDAPVEPTTDPAGDAHGTLRYSGRPLASSSGILRMLVRPGQKVTKGDVVAKVFNVFGRVEETLRAEHDAVVLGYTDSAVAYPGAPVLAFGIIGSETNAPETA